ncbi:IucA/IucC family protein [Acuticoccus yangtzensis]|uniref:IucA/IucC family protein n=1 Tax=Acuticoccus yangtzensis TaxID=1443441 RepID=UPI0009497E00|nr:IucA/IucC family protein [Acuticoccus yangtzensis]
MPIDKSAAFELADAATFEAFANAYLRELDPGTWRSPRCVEWRVGDEGDVIRADVAYVSAAGPHRFGGVWLCRNGREPAAMEPFDAVFALAREAYRRHGGPARTTGIRTLERELMLRIALSANAVTDNLANAPDGPPADDFIGAESSVVFGHTFHPTPKSVQGLSTWQREAYVPENRGGFRLTAFAASEALVAEDTAGRIAATAMMARIAGPHARTQLRHGERLLLMHPLQAEALTLDPDIAGLIEAGRLRPLGPAGPAFAATSSLRTVWSEASPFMLKFSLPVRITNSMRINRMHELAAGVVLARYFRRTRTLDAVPRLGMLHDPAWATLVLPGRPESGFETILRQNPFRGARAKNVVTIAALTGEGVAGRPSLLKRIVQTYANAIGTPLPIAANAWFAAYLECALVPLVMLYDRTGVAVEAHQQNALLVFDRGRPERLVTRDNQGLYLAHSYADALAEIVPEAASVPDLVFDEAEVSRRFAYYLVVNQIFGVIARLGRDGLADEDDLLARLRRRVDRLSRETSGAGRRFCRDLLDRPTIAAKANLAARLLDVDELGAGPTVPMYADMPNVLHAAAAHTALSDHDAVRA